MELTDSDRIKLHAALKAAFPGKSELARMLKHHLGVALADISGEGGLKDVVFAVMEDLDSRGKLDDLIAGACEANPNNALLRPFCDGLVPPPEPSIASMRFGRNFARITRP